MSKARIIARLDIKGANLIKGVHLEGLRIIGNPREFASRYYTDGIDEIIYMDCVASLYGRNNLGDLLADTVKDIFVPITVCGGLRSLCDVAAMLRAGADKVAINTAAVSNPNLISEVARQYGSQAMVLSVEAKRVASGRWCVMTDYGREKTDIDVVDWVKRGVALGAGEILVTSVDREGTRQGFDVELVQAISSEVNVPVVASGGMGEIAHVIDVVRNGGASGVAIADVLHYKRKRVSDIRLGLLQAGVRVRNLNMDVEDVYRYGS